LLVAITTFFAFVALQGSAYQLAGCPCIWQKRCESEESYIYILYFIYFVYTCIYI